ncbi:MAG: ABC transporter ATP-binding protein [Actinomycetota bacterium]|nr:ABC transporter ATP-binding protein [Actinomycetota bacterium]
MTDATGGPTARGVELSDICLSFDTGGERLQVLDNVSFAAPPESFVAILGPSGCGKSTTLKLVGGLLTADSGDLGVPDPSEIGFVFQTSRLLPWRTLHENLEIARTTRARIMKREFRNPISHYLELAGLSDSADYYPRALSGGMQQRAAIARAFSVEPSVLLMDEPFSSLDELTARAQRGYLHEIYKKHRTTVLFVTHNPSEAITLATSIVVVSNRPATVIEHIPVDLPYPRRMDGPEAIELQRHILGLLGVTDLAALA